MSPMNNRLLVPRKKPGLLDLVPGAAAAYSLRSLSRSYAGPVVTVRRSSDDAEEDFTAAEVSDGTLAAFCGAGDGFVKTWHSQTGSNDATQTTAGYQPKIVSSGVVVTEEGKPAIQFDGSDDFLVGGSAGNFNELHNGNAAVFAVLSVGLTSNPAALYVIAATSDIDSTQVGTQIFYDDRAGINNNAYRVAIQRGVSGTSPGAITHGDVISPQQQFLLSQLLDVANATADERLSAYINSSSRLAGNVSTTTPSASSSTSALYIGRAPGGLYEFAGHMQELIVYTSDQTANRQLIEGNIAWGWSV